MSGEIITTAGRSADSIATEIRVICAQAQQVLTFAAVKIGQNLIEAKNLVPHGEWGDYIKHSCGFSQRTANNYMKLAQEVGNSQTFSNLPYSKALALLALPEGERESFAEEHDVASLPVRELEKQIRELTMRAEAAEASDQAARAMLATATEENGAMRQRLSSIDADYRAQLDVVDAENDKLRQALQDAQSSPAEISAEEAERLRKDGADAASAAAMEQIAAAQALQKATEDDNAELKEKVRSLQEELRKKSEEKAKGPAVTANPNYGAFKAAFEALVPAFQQVCKYAVAAADSPEQVTANRNAIKGLLLKLGGLADREVVWNAS